ncbi:MAG: hypothetical protein H5T72_00895 [Actinobacteria bacterium]|nr:hypothetical protein [Actinomycetota bacterium]
MVSLGILVLFLASFLPFAGCGSAGQEAYFREMRDLNEKLAARMGELLEETTGSGHPGEGTGKAPAEILEEMAAVLEEGILELSRVKVPVGAEEAHAGLLELLSEAVAGYREVASALEPRLAEEEPGAHEEAEGEAGGEESGHPTGEEGEGGHPPSLPGGEEVHTEGH